MAVVLIMHFLAFAAAAVVFIGAQWCYSCCDQSEMCMTYGNSMLRCTSVIIDVAVYQPVVIRYQARCYGISALQQATYHGCYRSIIRCDNWIVSLFLAANLACTAVGLFITPARQPGTRRQMNLEISAFLMTLNYP